MLDWNQLAEMAAHRRADVQQEVAVLRALRAASPRAAAGLLSGRTVARLFSAIYRTIYHVPQVRGQPVIE